PSCSTTRDPRRDKGPRSVRGRQSANPRITGGLVSSDQDKRSITAALRSGEAPRVPSVVPSARSLDHSDRLGQPRRSGRRWLALARATGGGAHSHTTPPAAAL